MSLPASLATGHAAFTTHWHAHTMLCHYTLARPHDAVSLILIQTRDTQISFHQIYTYMYMYVYIYIYIHAYMYKYVYIAFMFYCYLAVCTPQQSCVRTHNPAETCAYAYASEYVCANICHIRIYKRKYDTYTHIPTHTYLHIHTCIYVYTYTYIYIYVYIFIYMYMYIRKSYLYRFFTQ